MLLSSAYFPPLSWLALAARDFTLSPDRVLPSVVQLEACENYQKQSYRNRCYILAGDGPQMLQVPVKHGKGEVPLNIQNVLVDYSTPWVVRTQRALDTAYETAAYYEYYRDDVFAVLNAQPETLWELNLSTIRLLLAKTGIACMLSPTSAFAAPGSEPDDYRFSIHPKQPDPILESLFTPRLSALDLLFNEGPDSILWLKKLSTI